MPLRNFIPIALGVVMVAGCALSIPVNPPAHKNAPDGPRHEALGAMESSQKQRPTYRVQALPENHLQPRLTVVLMTPDQVEERVADLFKSSASVTSIEVTVNTLDWARQNIRTTAPQFLGASLVYVVTVRGDDILWPFAMSQVYGNGAGNVGGSTPADGNKVVTLCVNPEDGRPLSALMPPSGKRGT